MLNQVLLVGALVDNPLETKTKDGIMYTNIIVAVPRPFDNTDLEHNIDYIECLLQNSLAYNSLKFCKKGDYVGIKGRIQTVFQESDNKKLEYSIKVVAERLSYLSDGKDEED